MLGGQFIKLVMPAVAALLLVACSNPSLEKLRHTPPKGTAFQNELAKLYMTYAQVEQNLSHYESSSRFAEKGLQAAYGNDVQPFEPVVSEHFSEEEASQFAEHRLHIEDMLDDETKRVDPVAAAGAIFFYDCMMDQQIKSNAAAAKGAVGETEEWQYCSDQWQAVMGDLREVRSAVIADQSLADVAPPPTVEQERYLIYFALDDFSLNDAAERTVALLYEELTKKTGARNVTIAVHGHTDTTGGDRYNMMLSNRRADTVKQMLVSLGLSPDDIQTYGFGETDLAVPTADGVLEPQNRRVEIVSN